MTTLENPLAPPDAANESLDPRDPLLRLSTFFDDGSVELLHERDRSGMLAAAGTVNGMRTIAFCTDGTVMGGAMGVEAASISSTPTISRSRSRARSSVSGTPVALGWPRASRRCMRSGWSSRR